MAEFFLGNFEILSNAWRQICARTTTKLLFSSPEWSELWWKHFAYTDELFLGAVIEGDKIIGIAPLRLKGNVLHFIGNDNVCDFLDFIIEPGKEEVFFTTTLDFINHKGITELVLSPLLPESTVATYLNQFSQSRWNISYTQEDVIVAVNLPGNITEYLALLSNKQRHELLRKERRLNEEGDINFNITDPVTINDINYFLHFFKESREDKKAFLTPEIKVFFIAIIDYMANHKMLRMGILRLNSLPVAIVLCFEYRDDIYLYNSGYDPAYRWLSVGLLSKYFSIKNSIEENKRRFDFLKGNEKYKYYLGGKETPLYRYLIQRRLD